jgi:hypothetical protein
MSCLQPIFNMDDYRSTCVIGRLLKFKTRWVIARSSKGSLTHNFKHFDRKKLYLIVWSLYETCCLVLMLGCILLRWTCFIILGFQKLSVLVKPNMCPKSNHFIHILFLSVVLTRSELAKSSRIVCESYISTWMLKKLFLTDLLFIGRIFFFYERYHVKLLSHPLFVMFESYSIQLA